MHSSPTQDGLVLCEGDPNEWSVGITRVTMERILKIEDGCAADCLALWMFYAYTCRFQKTNRAYAKGTFVMKGLGFGEDRFRKAKALLVATGLVEDVRATDEEGKVTGWYIKVRYLVKMETTPPDFHHGGFTQGVANHEQMLEDSNGKCSRTVNKDDEGIPAGKVEKLKRQRREKMPSKIPTKEELIDYGNRQTDTPGVNVAGVVNDLLAYCEDNGYDPSRMRLRTFLKNEHRSMVNGTHAYKNGNGRPSYAPTMEKDFTPEGKPMCTGSRLNALAAQMEAAEAEQMEVQDAA